MATNQDLINYYAALLILQYKNLSNAKATTQAIIEIIMVYEIIESVKNGYNIDTAIGTQQDILGKYIGIKRQIDGIDFTRTYFGFLTYAETPPKTGISGYANYTDPVPDVQYRMYSEEGGDILVLNDEEYRLFQRLRVKINYSNASLKDIDDILLEIFEGTASVIDNGDMELTYTFPSDKTRLVTIANSVGVIPRPMGVNVIINFI